jgi:hypothetical protein
MAAAAAGLPQQLPSFLRHSIQLIADAQQPLTTGALVATISFVRLVNQIKTHDSYAAVHGV